MSCVIKVIVEGCHCDCKPATPPAPKIGKGDSVTMEKMQYPIFAIPEKTKEDVTKITFNYQSDGEPQQTLELAGQVATPEAPQFFYVTPNIPGKCWWTERDKSGLESLPSPAADYTGTDETPPPAVAGAPSIGKGDTIELPDPPAPPEPPPPAPPV